MHEHGHEPGHDHVHGHAGHHHCEICGQYHEGTAPCPIPHAHSARPSALWIELREHVPFSVAAASFGLIVAGIICIIGWGPQVAPSAGSPPPAGAHEIEHRHAEGDGHDHAKELRDPGILFFHLFHPAHVLFSAMATTAMFRRYDRRLWMAVGVGLGTSVLICGMSDVIMPHVSLLILGIKAPWHICIIEHPGLVLPFSAVGMLVGLAATASVLRTTIVSHSMHVLTSTMASIFYMVGPLGMTDWIQRIGWVFFFVVLAVVIPCCLSDIVSPLLMSRQGHEEYLHAPHHH